MAYRLLKKASTSGNPQDLVMLITLALPWSRRPLLPSTKRRLLFLLLALMASPARAADLDAAPIRYSQAPAHNVIAQLQERIDAGQTVLAHEDHFGYLRSLLHELQVP